MLPLVLIWAGIEVLYRCAPNNYTYKYEIIQQHKNCETYILGNSHSFYGINPAFFSRATCNMSNISQILYFDELIFNTYLQDLPNIKNIVLNVDYFSLSETINEPELLWRRYFYKEQMHLNVTGISAFDPRNYSLALAPRFNLTLENIKKYCNTGTLIECDENGAGANYGINAEVHTDHMGKVIAAKHNNGNNDFSGNIQILKNLIAACKKRDINVILVTMPVTSLYAKYIDKQRMQRVVKECEYLEKYQNVEYLNLFQDARFNDNDFYDVDHLNTVGAKKCSVIINLITKMQKER